MFVHAHPDDESSQSPATMSRYVDEGAQVTLVTCTLGELGEILVPELEHLSPKELGAHRIGELTRAMETLGVTDHVWLGGQGHYHDSGMATDEQGNVIPRDELPEGAFWAADLLEAADHPGPPAAGDRHLRPERQLRPSRPHPGPPRHHVRIPAGGSAVVPPRPGRALAGQPDPVDHLQPHGVGCGLREGAGSRSRDGRGFRPRGHAATLQHRSRADRSCHRLRRTGGTLRGRPGRLPQPGRPGEPVLEAG